MPAPKKMWKMTSRMELKECQLLKNTKNDDDGYVSVLSKKKLEACSKIAVTILK
jgi:hypothetical protein